jgi:signal transduction histidine kinase
VTEFVRLQQAGAAREQVTDDLRQRAAHMQTEIFLRAQELQKTNQQLHEAVRVREEVLSAVSHDLKGPLTVIKGKAQLLEQWARSQEMTERDRLQAGLQHIATTAMHMTEWIDELLDAARLEVGQQLTLRRAPTDLVELARKAVTDQQQGSPQHTIGLKGKLPFLVGDWDAARLRRVVDNLLANAVKYSPDGGEVLVTIDREEDGTSTWAVLRVGDHGVGIPAADQARLFERFHRGGNVAARIGGTGIGLAGAQQIVRQHGGRIEVESREDDGSVFTVRLPLASVEESSADL